MRIVAHRLLLRWMWLLTVTFCLVAPQLASAGSAELELEYAGSTLWSRLGDIQIRDSLVYATIVNGLVVLNIVDPDCPTFVSQAYYRDGYSISLVLSGNYAYVTAWGGTRDGSWHGSVYAVDISNPSAPVVVGQAPTGPDAYEIAAHQDYLYVGTRGDFQVYSIVDPASPSLIRKIDSIDYVFNIKTSGGYAYAANDKVLVFDLACAAEPALLAIFNTPKSAVDLCVADTLLFVADDDPMWPSFVSALTILNIVSPEQPSLVASHQLPQGVGEVAVAGDLAYVGGTLGMFVLDVSNLDSIQQVGLYPSPGGTWSLEIMQDYAVLVGAISTATDFSPDPCDTCRCAGNQSSLPDARTLRSGLQIVDISNPADLCARGAYPLPGHVTRVAGDGHYAYAADHEESNSLNIIDVSQPDTVVLVGSIEMPGPALDMAVTGNLLLTANGTSGLNAYDISNPEAVTHLGELGHGIGPIDVAVRGELAYVSAWTSGLVIVDLSDSSFLEIVGQCVTPYPFYRIALLENYALIALRENGLAVVDISDVGNPTLLGRYPTAGNTIAVGGAGGFAYIDEDGYLSIIDLSDPTSPRLKTRLHIGAWFRDLTVWGDHVVAVNGWDGLVFVNVSDPLSAFKEGFYDTPGFSEEARAFGDYLYVGDNWSFIRLHRDLATGVDDDWMAGDGELPEAFTLYPSYPNPFNATTMLEFVIPRRSSVRLEIYSILGRRVKSLINREMPAGTHRVTWDGTDSFGRSVASGVYFCRLTIEQMSCSQKMLLLK